MGTGTGKNILEAQVLRNEIKRRLIKHLISIFAVFFVGTIYYWVFEDLSFLDALFFTGITISTVGYGMPDTISSTGRIFTLFLILAGLSVVLYSVSYITALLVEGELTQLFKVRRTEKRVSKMNNHIIVVGIGNIGTQVVNQLLRFKEDVVGIDANITEKEIRERLIEDGSKLVFINGDATNENVLLKAGIKQARALITTLPDDALNIFVTLTAKNMNPNIYVVSNISNINNLTKFIYAGVDHPIATAEIAGVKMVETIILRKQRENVLDVLNIRDKRFRVEIVDVSSTNLEGKRIEELRLKEKYNVYIVALLKGEEFVLGPSKNEIICKDCKLIAFGEEEGLSRFRNDFLQAK
ncbi:potassium channel protein [Fervidobacterium riparium]|uniref:Voltage-gated potassium channel n=2 Tax=Fervidobacterium gondwanense TaxID=44754 RepID=A0A1M7RUF6_FERGO|nr:potassium channel protein [Fervidobacterium gondwanense]SHN49893.1 voltage-gated potassium channel [Fervidobacterium gondwanense DSM 13020]